MSQDRGISSRDLAGIGGVLLLALMVRLFAATGDILYDPAVYAQNAYNLLQGSFTLQTDSWYAHRLPVFVPVALFYSLFGVGNLSTHLWPLLLSLGQLALLMWAGTRLFNRTTGLLAGTLLALHPLDAYYAGVLNPDMPLAAFFTGAVALWLVAVETESRPSPGKLMAAGALAALAAITRPYALLLGPSLLIHALWRRSGLRPLLIFGAGFAAALAPVLVAYAVESGDPFYRLKVVQSTYGQLIEAPSMQLLYYPSLLWRWRELTGMFALLAAGAVAAALLRPSRERMLLLLWMAPLALYLQLGTMSFSSYVPILKKLRFLTPLSAPAALLLASWLAPWLGAGAARAARARWTRHTGRLAVLSLLGAIMLSSSYVLHIQRRIHVSRAESYRRGAQLLQSDGQDLVLFDHWRTAIRMAWYLDFERGAHLYRGADDTVRMRRDHLPADSGLGYLAWYADPSSIPDSWVVIDQRTLLAATTDAPGPSAHREGEIPAYASSPPESWRREAQFGELSVYRPQNVSGSGDGP